MKYQLILNYNAHTGAYTNVEEKKLSAAYSFHRPTYTNIHESLNINKDFNVSTYEMKSKSIKIEFFFLFNC